MGTETSKYISPDDLHKQHLREEAELKQKRIEQEDIRMKSYKLKLTQLIHRHSLKYLPYRTSCPSDIKYSDLLRGVDTTVLIQLLQNLVEDQLLLQQILSGRYDNICINPKKPRNY